MTTLHIFYGGLNRHFQSNYAKLASLRGIMNCFEILQQDRCETLVRILKTKAPHMDYLGKHYGFDTYYLDLTREDYVNVLPKSNWFGFAIVNKDFDDSEGSLINTYLRYSINNGLLAFHVQGIFGGKIHLAIDLLITQMEINENHPEIDITTIGDNDTGRAAGLWECYGASGFPDRADYDSVKLVCTSFDFENYMDELKSLLIKFNNGWLPSGDFETNDK